MNDDMQDGSTTMGGQVSKVSAGPDGASDDDAMEVVPPESDAAADADVTVQADAAKSTAPAIDVEAEDAAFVPEALMMPRDNRKEDPPLPAIDSALEEDSPSTSSERQDRPIEAFVPLPKRKVKLSKKAAESMSPDEEPDAEPTRKKAKKSAPKKKGKKTQSNRTSSRGTTQEVDSPAAAAEDEEDEGEEEEDTKLYCFCKSLYDEERMMIACDRCNEWYHGLCMGMKDEQGELVDQFICPNCEPQTDLRTTWKPKCLKPDCTHAALRPLSRYCSERCGILVAAQRIAKAKTGNAGVHTVAPPNGAGVPSTIARRAQQEKAQEKAWVERLLHAPRIETAKRREGIVIWTEKQDRLGWFASLMGDAMAEEVLTLLAAARVSDEKSGNTLDAQPAELVKDLHQILPQVEELARLQRLYAKLQQTQFEVNGTLDLLGARTKLLHLAEDRVATLKPTTVDEPEVAAVTKKSTKTKLKKGAKEADASSASTSKMDVDVPSIARGQPRCGYDERLHWNDTRFSAWVASEAGSAMLHERMPLDGELDDTEQIPRPMEAEGEDEEQRMELEWQDVRPTSIKICATAKRRCKRHGDWSVVRDADFEGERELQTETLATLAREVQRLEAGLERMQHEVKRALHEEADFYRPSDEQIALALASEGSRRISTRS